MAESVLWQDVSASDRRIVGKPLPCRVVEVTTLQHCSWRSRREENDISRNWNALLACLGTAATAAALAAPAQADPSDENFIGALNQAGVNFGEPANATAIGQSICPMLTQPGGSFAAAASRVGSTGMSPQMAQLFTTIAIQTYCPTEIANIAGGNLSGLPQLPGVPGMPAL